MTRCLVPVDSHLRTWSRASLRLPMRYTSTKHAKVMVRMLFIWCHAPLCMIMSTSKASHSCKRPREECESGGVHESSGNYEHWPLIMTTQTPMLHFTFGLGTYRITVRVHVFVPRYVVRSRTLHDTRHRNSHTWFPIHDSFETRHIDTNAS